MSVGIDDTWKGKPDESLLDQILAEAWLLPSQALFVGDRYDVDLRLPEQRGCPVYLSQSIEQLLRLEELLKNRQISTGYPTDLISYPSTFYRGESSVAEVLVR